MLFEPTVERPVVGWPESPRYDGPAEPERTLQLSAGDCLYLPRGVPHRAESLNSTSLHLTIGIRSPTWLDLLDRTLKRARELPALRASLPLRYHADEAAFASEVGRMLDLVRSWIQTLDTAEIASDEAHAVLKSRQPARPGQLLARTIDEVGPDTVMERVPGIRIRLSSCDASHVVVDAGSMMLRFPARTFSALTVVRDARVLTARDLVPHLDEAGALVLVRRLHREGIVRSRRVEG